MNYAHSFQCISYVYLDAQCLLSVSSIKYITRNPKYYRKLDYITLNSRSTDINSLGSSTQCFCFNHPTSWGSAESDQIQHTSVGFYSLGQMEGPLNHTYPVLEVGWEHEKAALSSQDNEPQQPYGFFPKHYTELQWSYIDKWNGIKNVKVWSMKLNWLTN